MIVGQVKLRPTKTNDRSGPTTKKAGDEEQSASQYKDMLLATNVENWYEWIKHLTFETEFFPLTLDEAQAIISAYNVYKGKKQHTTQAEDQILSELETKIDSRIVSYTSGAFIRLSTRSPKDATIAADLTTKLYNEELSKQSKIDENIKLICLIEATTQALKVKNGKEALTLLKTSERSNEDLLFALNSSSVSSPFNIQIIVRRWETIHSSMEFRGFVYNKTLTALSQYFYSVFFPNLFETKSEVQKMIQEFYDREVKDLIPLDNYIVDFGIVEGGVDEDEKRRVVVIELNPFGCGTDPGLFSWAKDKSIVEGSGFEFRIREQEFDVKPGVQLQWRQIISDK